MMKNNISFNYLISRIGECSKRMTIVRHEIEVHKELGIDTNHQKRELINLSNELSILRSSIDYLRRNSKSIRSINF